MQQIVCRLAEEKVRNTNVCLSRIALMMNAEQTTSRRTSLTTEEKIVLSFVTSTLSMGTTYPPMQREKAS
jgi:hypothetical protein